MWYLLLLAHSVTNPVPFKEAARTESKAEKCEEFSPYATHASLAVVEFIHMDHKIHNICVGTILDQNNRISSECHVPNASRPHAKLT